ncbi:MAG: hypothetical protein NZM09_10790, partial [Ignavibacterium sp.]|nr:hypothetical protein [Ignavibacterium sp.]MDW8376164.1 hypothetical protein [Ignavibacteriales bacterium]
MKFLYLLLLIITLSYSCSLKKSNNNKNITNTNPIVIDKINLILDNSGSMVGYLKEDKFIRNLTNLIAELEWMKSKNDSTFIIKELNFYTFENNFLL